MMMVMMNAAERTAGGGEADGAVVLTIEIMEHRGGEDEDKNNGHGLFHAFAIIACLEDGVKPELVHPSGPARV
jgi:hypothetical protein